MTRCGGWKVGLAALSSLIDLEMSVRMDLEELVCDTRRADPWGCWGCPIWEEEGKEVLSTYLAMALPSMTFADPVD